MPMKGLELLISSLIFGCLPYAVSILVHHIWLLCGGAAI